MTINPEDFAFPSPPPMPGMCNAVGPQRPYPANMHGPCECWEQPDHDGPHVCANCGWQWGEGAVNRQPQTMAKVERLGIVGRARRSRFWRGHR